MSRRNDARSEFLRQLGPLPEEIIRITGGGPAIPSQNDLLRRVEHRIRGKRKRLPLKIKIKDPKDPITILNSDDFRNYMMKMADLLKSLNEMKLESFIATCQMYEEIHGIRDTEIWEDFTGLMQQWARFAASLRAVAVEYREFQKSRYIDSQV